MWRWRRDRLCLRLRCLKRSDETSFCRIEQADVEGIAYFGPMASKEPQGYGTGVPTGVNLDSKSE